MKNKNIILAIVLISSVLLSSCQTWYDGRNPQVNNTSFIDFLPWWASTNNISTNGVSQ